MMDEGTFSSDYMLLALKNHSLRDELQTRTIEDWTRKMRSSLKSAIVEGIGLTHHDHNNRKGEEADEDAREKH